MRLMEIARVDSEAMRARAAADQERLRLKRERERADQREAAEKQTTDLAKRREQIRERALRKGERTRKHWERTSQQDRRRYTDWLAELSDIFGAPIYDAEFDAAACASDQARVLSLSDPPGPPGAS